MSAPWVLLTVWEFGNSSVLRPGKILWGPKLINKRGTPLKKRVLVLANVVVLCREGREATASFVTDQSQSFRSTESRGARNTHLARDIFVAYVPAPRSWPGGQGI